MAYVGPMTAEGKNRIMIYGPKERWQLYPSSCGLPNMSKWLTKLKRDCLKREAFQLHDRCDLICPDLPKVL